jgi:hypothetical protein
MVKAKKAPLKKTTRPQNRGLKLVSALFVGLGLLVVLSMIISSVFTQTPQVILPTFTPIVVPTAVPTP